MQKNEKWGSKTSKKEKGDGDKEDNGETKFQTERRKAALFLDCTGDVGMENVETWDIEMAKEQYNPLRKAFNYNFASEENIVATRHRFFSQG